MTIKTEAVCGFFEWATYMTARVSPWERAETLDLKEENEDDSIMYRNGAIDSANAVIKYLDG